MAPLSYSRITSSYTNARYHPILKVRRPHHGIDYAAPTGTPVWSVSHGKVVFKGWAGGFGRLVNVSSGYGSFAGGLVDAPPAYGISKAALNALTVVLDRAVPADRDVLVNAVSPGWVRTRMGGAEADRSVEEGADGIVTLATLARGGPRGGFFRDGAPIPW